MQELSGLICVFFLLPFRLHADRNLSSATFPYSYSSCRALFPPCHLNVRSHIRVHHKHRVHRRGMSRRNIDVLIEAKSNRRQERRCSVRLHFFSYALFVAVATDAASMHNNLDMYGDACSRKLIESSSSFPRAVPALAAGKSNPKAKQTMRSPSEAPAATRPVCGNIYTEVACTRPSLRPCTPLHGCQSPPRFHH